MKHIIIWKYYYNCLNPGIITAGFVEFTIITDNIFILTCISNGGPATTVTWTRDDVTITEGTETQYNTGTGVSTHNLTVTERLQGLYTCTIANYSASITVQGNIRV